MRLGVFPLPLILLPGGKTRLRIFEPRYIRLVKQAVTGEGFALSSYLPEAENNSSELAAWVEIVDFSILEDGLLSIDVQAKSMVKLTQFELENDGLRFASAMQVKHWAGQTSSDKTKLLAQSLSRFFSKIPEYESLYPSPKYDEPAWVCARLVELLPLSIERKLQFAQPESFERCVNFLHTVINGEKNSDLFQFQTRNYN